MRKKKILYIVTDIATAGGVMSIVSKKANFLAQNGYSVDIMSIRVAGKPFYPLEDTIQVLNFSKQGKRFLQNVITSIQTINGRKYDIVISADSQYLTWVLPFFSNAKNVLELHQSYDGIKEYLNRKFNSKIIVSFFSFLKKVAYPFYDIIVTLTEEDKKKWGYKKTIVIPNFHTLTVKKENSESRHSIVCVGRFHHQKGYHLLVEAWKIVTSKYPDWTLDYYGEAVNTNTLNMLKELSAPTTFVLKGYERNPDVLYGGYYLNIVPSISESFSLSTIEAMCYGVPTISFDTTGPRSIITNGGNGILVKSYDTVGMANEIMAIIEDRCTRKKMSDSCLKTANNYKREMIMARWERLFDKIL